MKTIEYAIEQNKTTELCLFFEHPEDVLFFDIENDGIFPERGIHLPHRMFFLWKKRLDEPALFRGDSFRRRRYPACISVLCIRLFLFSYTFNGTTFDIPFLQAKCKKHALLSFSPHAQCDIYKKTSPYKNLLHLPGCRQKQLEEYAGIYREDKFNGGQLIELYRAYCETPDDRLLEALLLHNREDLEGMTRLFSVIAIPSLFEGGYFSVEKLSLEEDTSPDAASHLFLRASLRPAFRLPAPLSIDGFSGLLKKCFLAGQDYSVLLRIPLYEGELKFFYPDYKNYSYLPAEDNAIHKSVAVYVDKSHACPLLPPPAIRAGQADFSPALHKWQGFSLFRTDHKEKQFWVMADDILNADPEMQKNYLKSVLQALIKTKPASKMKQ